MSAHTRPRSAALALVLVAATVAVGAQLAAPRARQTDDAPLAAQGYPGPGTAPPTAAPTATPALEADGRFPPPAGGPHRIERLPDSPYRDLLLPLEASLIAADAGTPAAWVTERFGNRLFDIAHGDSEGGTPLDRDATEALLGAFFAEGARPLLQGYFAVDDGEIACLDVVSAIFDATVPYPAGRPPLGPQPPAELVGDAATFRACRDQGGEWIWQSWAYGGYHAMVGALRAQHGLGTSYVVVRP